MKGYKLFDTSALLSLIIEADRPDILKIITEEDYCIQIPKEVYREINQIEVVAKLLKEDKIELLPACSKEKVEQIKSEFPFFHDGEIGVLLNCHRHLIEGNKSRCIIDERDATNYAKRYELPVNGVIGLLLWLKKNRKLNIKECAEIYNKLSGNPRLPKSHLKLLIEDG